MYQRPEPLKLVDPSMPSFPRHEFAEMPGESTAEIFACYSNERLIVGCSDPFGSVEPDPVLARLRHIYGAGTSAPLAKTAGAGIGLKFLIDNSANFYIYREHRRKTIFACSFLLKGLKANLTPAKHIHLSFD